MVKKNQKLPSHYLRLIFVVETYIALFFFVPFLCFLLSMKKQADGIEAGVAGIWEAVFHDWLKWSLMSLPIVVLLFVIRLFFNSGYVILADNRIENYKYIFSKKPKIIKYDDISHCVVAGGLWKLRGKYFVTNKMFVYDANGVAMVFEIYYRLCLELAIKVDFHHFELVGESGALKKIDTYFKTDFASLTYDEQSKLFKYYCNLTKSGHRTAEEILNPQKKTRNKKKKS